MLAAAIRAGEQHAQGIAGRCPGTPLRTAAVLDVADLLLDYLDEPQEGDTGERDEVEADANQRAPLRIRPSDL